MTSESRRHQEDSPGFISVGKQGKRDTGLAREPHSASKQTGPLLRCLGRPAYGPHAHSGTGVMDRSRKGPRAWLCCFHQVCVILSKPLAWQVLGRPLLAELQNGGRFWP